ncbi:MAG: hypothetical protein IKK85_00290 [Clostridia bacterium]|nr:hypothetical protein [Clostridia bacterium]
MLNSIISFILSAFILFPSFVTRFIDNNEKFRIVVPESWELCVGDSRTIECVFGESVTDYTLVWCVEPASVAAVDEWGRVTAKAVGTATVTAKGNGFSDSVQLNVVSSPTVAVERKQTVNFSGQAAEYTDNLQKVVYRFHHGHKDIPSYVSSVKDYSSFKTAVTADGAVWEITDYGVLRTDNNAADERDKYQRFMGDRYFYGADSTKVRGIFADGNNGIWTVTDAGITHIDMISATGTFKAEYLSGVTQDVVSRMGYVNEAVNRGGTWHPIESDNDGLWTSMYGAGELMRYALMRDNPAATPEQIAQAKKAAYLSSEAVLMLYYISMRNGTTEAYVRRQTNNNVPGSRSDRWLSADALEVGGNATYKVPSKSPAQLFKEGKASLFFTLSTAKYKTEGYYDPLNADDWSDPSSNETVSYARRTRLIEGFPVRTFSFKHDNIGLTDTIYWNINADGTATGLSEKPPHSEGYLLNGENLRGYNVDASKAVPERLWNDIVGAGYNPEDIIYKTDTSADELVGHMFVFKLMYDIIAPEDPELKQLLIEAVDSLAQHLSDNSYMLLDASGQPTSWGNFGRTVYCAGTSVAQSPLHALVLLDVFKTAAYITGYQKWENEYRMAALDPAYEYAEVVAQYYDRMVAAIQITIGDATHPILANLIYALKETSFVQTVYRLVVNYSDEEMAMLGFYNIFQLEKDEELLELYRDAVDQWWRSIRYSENPLWYYIYQLAYPEKQIKDAYGNNILKTASWSLSRHPADLVQYLASNKKRDDIGVVDLSGIGLKTDDTLSYNIQTSGALPELNSDSSIGDYIKYFLKLMNLDWAVAAPDERAFHKYNESSYQLDSWYNTNRMQGSTTYTLPFWLGMYHGMLAE